MPHLRSLRIDCHLRDWNNMIDFNILTKLNLKSLYLNAFELKDYTFIKNLSKNLEELLIYADTMGSSIYFDCKWLLQYKSQYHPHRQELRAHLSHDVPRHSGVIPYAHTEPHIDNESGHKLNHCDSNSAHSGLYHQRHFPWQLSSEPF